MPFLSSLGKLVHEYHSYFRDPFYFRGHIAQRVTFGCFNEVCNKDRRVNSKRGGVVTAQK